jgi:hypothetical protein
MVLAPLIAKFDSARKQYPGFCRMAATAVACILIGFMLPELSFGTNHWVKIVGGWYCVTAALTVALIANGPEGVMQTFWPVVAVEVQPPPVAKPFELAKACPAVTGPVGSLTTRAVAPAMAAASAAF